MAAVKRPQSNGKIERWFGTEEAVLPFWKGLDRTVACYNRMPHLSLDMTPAQACEAKKRNS